MDLSRPDGPLAVPLATPFATPFAGPFAEPLAEPLADPEPFRPFVPPVRAPADLAPVGHHDLELLVETPAGPLLPGGRSPDRRADPSLFVPLLSPVDRGVVAVLTLCWAFAFVSFWWWWFQPQHRLDWFGLVLNSALLLYLSYLPAYFLFMVNRLRGVDRNVALPFLRVAFVVTKAPSEPWGVARRTLEAMTRQEFEHPYDVWLCDEDPSPDTLAWCAAHGVRVSTRRGVAAYHRASWPRRTRCKEGNLAYFYDHWGYRHYDVVAQLDCDHEPVPTYLAEMVRPFSDPAIGWVSAPSSCDANAAQSWAARGRLHYEATFHGPSQTGHQAGFAPVCIGSHYAVRTTALRTVGGVGPELAEDFSTTFLLSSAGWDGAFAHRAQAHGEGPLTVAAMLTQEFQWSRSLVTVLLDLVPHHLRRLPWRLRARYLFALLHYPLLALTSTVGLLLPPVAAVTGRAWVDVDLVQALVRWFLVGLCLLVLVVFLRARGFLRPVWAPVISWEGWLYGLVRWPFITYGVLAALVQKVRPRSVTFAVTPKSRDGLERLPLRWTGPYLVVALVCGAAAVVGELTTGARGYVFLSLVTAVAYSAVTFLLPLLHARETARAAGTGFARALRATAAVPLGFAAAVSVPVVIALVLFPAYVAPVLHR